MAPPGLQRRLVGSAEVRRHVGAEAHAPAARVGERRGHRAAALAHEHVVEHHHGLTADHTEARVADVAATLELAAVIGLAAEDERDTLGIGRDRTSDGPVLLAFAQTGTGQHEHLVRVDATRVVELGTTNDHTVGTTLDHAFCAALASMGTWGEL